MAEPDKPTQASGESPISDPRLTTQGAISDEGLRKAEELVEQEEGAANRLTGWAATIVTAIAVGKRTGKTVVPEVMVPLIATKAELDLVKGRIDAMAAEVAKETGAKVVYQVGTMIELPRASLMAGEIAQAAEFFSFGTNDLTQTTFGISRDDAASFLGAYTARGILAADPFVSIDREGVGELIRIGVERGRKTRPKLKVGICGEHGGDPASVAFCHQVGLDYVSCSPFRVPIARLAAAQAALGKDAASQA